MFFFGFRMLKIGKKVQIFVFHQNETSQKMSFWCQKCYLIRSEHRKHLLLLMILDIIDVHESFEINYIRISVILRDFLFSQQNNKHIKSKMELVSTIPSSIVHIFIMLF